MEDAFAIADEFYEWMHPDHADDDDLIVYYNEQELESLYYKKKIQSLSEDLEDYGSAEEHY
jgi:hypothetical protein